jgi:RNA polymerase sigma factor (TIGR02999 family)
MPTSDGTPEARAKGDITRLLEAWKAGDEAAGSEVVAKTYAELRRLAHAYVRRERPGNSLQATALLNEAFMRLLHRGPGTVDSRDAFFRLMAAEMRRRLIDHARRRLAQKRGGRVVHESMETGTFVVAPATEVDVEAALTRLDDAVDQLGTTYPRAAQVVQLRYLGGLTTEETAATLGISSGTVKRDWTFARAWLAAALDERS